MPASRHLKVDEPTIEIGLAPEEWFLIAQEPKGEGGYQTYLRELQSRAEMRDGVIIRFNKRELGDLLFHMMYGWERGRGGFQGRLRKAFGPALQRRLGDLPPSGGRPMTAQRPDGTCEGLA